ncbi:MAG TPA: PEGA domain-containing protein [Pirellulales bacterium]|nr:PEGA domain-containing protein [Pirellulales bacterium]
MASVSGPALRQPKPPFRRLSPVQRVALYAACCVMLCAAGCVQRRITIRTNPPGALVYIDKHEIGRTPCSVEYIYYGTREIRLIKDGFETLTVTQFIPPPFYEIPPFDFVSENVVPYELRDERTFNYQLVPTRVVPTNQLLGRAENLRQATKLERMAAPPPPPPRPVVQPQMPVPPPAYAPTLGLPRDGRGYFMQPGGGGMPNYPQPGYVPPQAYPQPGTFQQPELLPPPGPMPPRGPE